MREVILVIRLSAMGDVALTLPVVKAVASDDKELLILTRPQFTAFFDNIPHVTCFPVDTKIKHRGIKGIYRLYRDLMSGYSIRIVIDLHAVIRSYLLCFLFRLSSVKVYRIDKGRSQKRDLVRKKILEPLPHSVDRYAAVFNISGMGPVVPALPSFVLSEQESEEARIIIEGYNGNDKKYLIGIAPFTRHKTKSWGEDKIITLINLLSEKYSCRFFLFGGIEEKEQLDNIASERADIIVLAGLYNIRTELALINRIDLMISMDSSNMHLAAISGVKTVSIWGGTHPYAGFSAYGQPEELSIGLSPSILECRPCSVYGSGRCLREARDYRCLEDIGADMVLDVIEKAGLIV